MDLGAGDYVGQYRLQHVLGTGAMGVVYQAVGPDGEPVALKMLRRRSDLDDEGWQESSRRFIREAKIRVDHPNVVKVLGAGYADRAAYLALELLDGATLQDRIKREGKIPWREMVDLARGIADGLHVVHELGIIHRDIKPANLFSLRDGTAKIVDFGVAKLQASPDDLTIEAAVIGTPSYLSPEQAQGEGEVDRRTDVWALGAVLYGMLTGVSPFRRSSIVKTLVAVLLEEPAPARELEPAIPESLAAIVGRCLEKKAERRYSTAAELSEALAAVHADPELRSPPPSLEPKPRSTSAPPEAETLPPPPAAGPIADGERRLVALVLASGVSDIGVFRGAIEERGGICISLMARGRAIGVFGAGAWEGDEVFRAVSAGLRARGHVALCAVAAGHAESTGATIAGEVVEAAERALSAEVVGVAVTADARRLLGGKLALERRAEDLFEVREQRSALAARSPRDASGEAAELSPFVGREVELAQLREAYRASLTRPVFACLVGGPGVGKTRLIREIEAEIDEAEIDEAPTELRLLAAGAEPLHRDTAHWLLASAIEGRARLGAMLRGWPNLRAEAPEQGREAVTHLIEEAEVPAEDAPSCATFLGALLGVPMAPSPELVAAQNDPRLMADQIRSALRTYLESMVRRGPMLVVLDDVQWTDDASLGLIEELTTVDGAPLLVLASARPEIDDRWPGRIAPPTTRIELRGLKEPETAELARTLMKSPLDAASRRRLHERTGGNPLFIEQLVLDLMESGEPPSSLGARNLPASVEAAVQSRLDHLPQGEKELCRRASVWGRPFDEASLVALGMDAPRSLLVALGQRGIVRGWTDLRASGRPRFRFHTPLLEEVAYSLLTDEHRTRLHYLAAAHLLDGEGYESAEVALHLERGGEIPLAAEYFAAAAHDASAIGDSQTALRWSARAFESGVPLNDPLALHLVRAEALRFLGRRTEQAEELTAALGYAMSPEQRAAVLLEQAVLAARRNDTAAALAAYDEAIAAAEESGDAGQISLALGRKATALAFAGQHDEAAETYARAAAETDPSDQVVTGFLAEFRGILASASGDIGAQVDAYREAIAAYEAVGDRRRAAGAENNVADAYNRIGAYAEAEAALEHAARNCRRVGNRVVEAYAWVNLGFACAMQGHLEQAADWVRRAGERAAEVDDTRLAAYSRAYALRVELLSLDATRADADAARELAERALVAAKAAAGVGLPSVEAVCLGFGGQAWRRAGDFGAALAASTAAIDIVERLGGIDEGEAELVVSHHELATLAGAPSAATAAVESAKRRLLDRASRIADESWRDRFLDDVAAHRQLLWLVPDAES